MLRDTDNRCGLSTRTAKPTKITGPSHVKLMKRDLARLTAMPCSRRSFSTVVVFVEKTTFDSATKHGNRTSSSAPESCHQTAIYIDDLDLRHSTSTRNRVRRIDG
jgi:hypothetical protein